MPHVRILLLEQVAALRIFLLLKQVAALRVTAKLCGRESCNSELSQEQEFDNGKGC